MRVMRRKKGDVIRVSDGDITEYEVELTELTHRGATGKIRTRQVTRQDRLFVWLGQAVPKGWKLDWIVEKAVELGCGGGISDSRRPERTPTGCQPRSGQIPKVATGG